MWFRNSVQSDNLTLQKNINEHVDPNVYVTNVSIVLLGTGLDVNTAYGECSALPLRLEYVRL